MKPENPRKYVLALSYQSDKTFTQLVEENLTAANYSHNSIRSRVVSVRQEFVRFLGRLVSDQKKRSESGEIKSSQVYSTMHELFCAISQANWTIPSDELRRFINGVANVVGFGDMPTTKDILDVFEIICEDYKQNNAYVSAELLGKHTAIREARLADTQENPAEPSGEIPSTQEKVEDQHLAAGAGA